MSNSTKHGFLTDLFLVALALLFVLIFSISSWGQGISISGQALSSSGRPIPNALIYVCPSSSTGIPCSPTASIYSSPTLNPLTQLSNPTSADQHGAFSLFVAVGYYITQVIDPSTGAVVYSTISGLTFIPSGFGPQAANTILGNCTGSSASPTFCLITADMLPAIMNATTFPALTISNGAGGELRTNGAGIDFRAGASFGLNQGAVGTFSDHPLRFYTNNFLAGAFDTTQNFNVTGSISGASLSTSGTLAAGTTTITGSLSVSSVATFGDCISLTVAPLNFGTICYPNVAGPLAYNLPSTSGTLALLNSPALSGIPTAPTAFPGTSTTQLATTQFVQTAVGSSSGASTVNSHSWTHADGVTALTSESTKGMTLVSPAAGSSYLSNAAISTAPSFLEVATSSSANSSGFLAESSRSTTIGTMSSFQTLARVPSLGIFPLRVWIVMGAPQAGATYVADDPFGSSLIGFRYSSTIDSTWKCYSADSAGSTIVDSGFTGDNGTAGHVFKLVPISGTVSFFIDGTQVCSISTHLPAPALGTVTQIDNANTGNAVGMAVAYAYYGETR